MRHLDWVCFQNRSGYAQATQDYVYALRSAGNYNLHMTILHNSPDQISMTAQRYAEVMAMMNNPLPNDNFTQIFHCIPDMQRRAMRGSKRTIGFGTFEADTPPEDWAKILNTNTAIICPSQFNVDAFKRAGVNKPIFHIPHCVDTELFHPTVEPMKVRDKFSFLFFATWKRRKGWRELFEAWFREFRRSDNVEMVLKTDRLSQSMREIADIRKNLGVSEEDAAPISYETRILKEIELPCFFKSVNCLVCPTYGEGFGIPGLQCMAVGVPVIITDHSGCTDYANEATATLLKPSGLILYNEMDGIPQFRNRKWANISVETIRQAMRHVVVNTDIVKKKAEYAAIKIAEDFGYKKTAETFDQMLDTLE